MSFLQWWSGLSSDFATGIGFLMLCGLGAAFFGFCNLLEFLLVVLKRRK